MGEVSWHQPGLLPPLMRLLRMVWSRRLVRKTKPVNLVHSYLRQHVLLQLGLVQRYRALPSVPLRQLLRRHPLQQRLGRRLPLLAGEQHQLLAGAPRDDGCQHLRGGCGWIGACGWVGSLQRQAVGCMQRSAQQQRQQRVEAAALSPSSTSSHRARAARPPSR